MSDFFRRISEARAQVEEQRRKKAAAEVVAREAQDRAQQEAEEKYRRLALVLDELGVQDLERMLGALREALNELELQRPRKVEYEDLRFYAGPSRCSCRGNEIYLERLDASGGGEGYIACWERYTPGVGVCVIDISGEVRVGVFAYPYPERVQDKALDRRYLGLAPYVQAERARILEWIGSCLAEWYESLVQKVDPKGRL